MHNKIMKTRLLIVAQLNLAMMQLQNTERKAENETNVLSQDLQVFLRSI